jgi:putative transposase
MPRPPRLKFPGAFYHVCNRGVAKMDIVKDDQDRRLFMYLIKEMVERFSLNLFSYCLMNNHFHLYFETRLANIDKAMCFLQASYSRYFNKRYLRIGPLFQSRYKSRLIKEDSDSRSLVRYIHQNPTEAGIVKNLEEYLWCSYACYVGTLPKWSWLNAAWILSQFHQERKSALMIFKKFHQERPMMTTNRSINFL